MVTIETAYSINNMAATYTGEALQGILRASATFHTQSLDLSKRDIDKLPEDFPALQNLLGLYLEGNRLVVFPEDILLKLRNLRWLDLRNNQLKVLPANISCLKELRTLLLEGNQLTTLPRQLGTLRHLNGLNIANNPLQYPPAHIIQQGTKAVLRYLADSLDDYVFVEDETLDDSSQLSWHTPEFTSSNIGAVNSGGEHTGCLPVPSSQKALLHVQTDPLHRTMNNKQVPLSNGRQEDGTQRRHNRKTLRNQKTDRISKMTNRLTPREVSRVENERISEIIDRQRNTKQLEEWREETKRQQQQHSNHVVMKPKITEFAPYGNDLQEPLPSQERLQTVESRRNAMAKKLQKYYNKSTVMKGDWTQESEDDENDATHPSTVRPSMEGVQLEPGWETKRAREYRLSAFTGDILVQTDNP